MSIIFSKIGGYIMAGLAALAGILTLFFQVKKAGREEAEAKVAKANAEAVKSMKDKENEIDALGHADVDRRFDRWLRDR